MNFWAGFVLDPSGSTGVYVIRRVRTRELVVRWDPKIAPGTFSWKKAAAVLIIKWLSPE